MLRSLGVIALAVTMSAQAEDTSSSPDGGDKPAPAQAAEAEGEQTEALLASTEPVGNRRLLPRPITLPARPDAGSDAGGDSLQVAGDCGLEDAIFKNKALPVAVRIYGPAEIAAQRSPEYSAEQRKAWDDAPKVFKAGRCGQKYMIQVQSRSKEQWAIKEARLEGAGGEVLKVTGIRSRLDPGDWNINLIVAVRTHAIAEADYQLLRVYLVGEDGRVAILQEVALP
jgi:hypothetical protein